MILPDLYSNCSFWNLVTRVFEAENVCGKVKIIRDYKSENLYLVISSYLFEIFMNQSPDLAPRTILRKSRTETGNELKLIPKSEPIELRNC